MELPKIIWTSGVYEDSGYVTIAANNLQEADNYVSKELNGKPYNVLGVDKKHSFNKSHYNSTQKFGIINPIEVKTFSYKFRLL